MTRSQFYEPIVLTTTSKALIRFDVEVSIATIARASFPIMWLQALEARKGWPAVLRNGRQYPIEIIGLNLIGHVTGNGSQVRMVGQRQGHRIFSYGREQRWIQSLELRKICHSLFDDLRVAEKPIECRLP
jgi:hypothetical protein